MDAKTYEELISGNQIYQLVTERLATYSADLENLKYGEMNNELLNLILDLYSDDQDFPYGNLRKFSITEILAYLQASHKYYLTKKLPEIEQSLLHIFSKYGQTHQLLAALALFFNNYKAKLIEHIKSEEKDFFPYIKKLLKAEKGELHDAGLKELLANTSIEDFNDTHDPIEDGLKEVSTIIQEYSESKEVPLPYRIFLNQVELFELELRKHAIIEDHVLVPMVTELEQRLKSAA